MSSASFILDISFSVFLVDSCSKLAKLEEFEKEASVFATTAPHLQPVAIGLSAAGVRLWENVGGN